MRVDMASGLSSSEMAMMDAYSLSHSIAMSPSSTRPTFDRNPTAP
jgi:hypothetical protein